MAIPLADWVDLTKHEYFRLFIADRGCAVKFIIGDSALLGAAESRIADLARDRLLPVVRVDAADTRLHMIQDVFFAIARNIDWDMLAQRWIEGVFRANQYTWPRPGQSVPLQEVAQSNNVDPALLRRQVLQWLTQHLMNESLLTQDFRSAMSNLCMRRLEPTDTEAIPPVIEWLRGDLRTIGAVRDIPISARITRHNGRAMMRSLCRWLRLTQSRGFVVFLDLRQVSRTVVEEGGRRFTPAAVFDTFEVLRQLIDDAESYEGLFLLVLADENFVVDPKRGLSAYLALKERLSADVHPQGHENPLAPLLTVAADDHADAARLPRSGGFRDMPYLPQRVAIEALRMGVPNRSAIKLLGSNERGLCDRFADSLHETRVRPDRIARGDVIAGSFGSGKSHLLGVFAQQALDQNYVVSQIAVSKETPLFDPERVYAAAMRNAVAPHGNDDVMALALARLNQNPEALQRLERWASKDGGLSSVFAAILYLWPRNSLATEDRFAIVRFLTGAKLGVAKVKQWLRAAGGGGLVKLFDPKPVKAAELALQRLRFAPRLFQAAGYAGWCILLDEVELMLRYTSLQRGKSYAELARWLGYAPEVATPGLVGVASITSDFTDVMLDQKRDGEKLPTLLESKGLEPQASLARIAIETLSREQHLLAQPTAEMIQRTLDRVRSLYDESYEWSPAPHSAQGGSAQITMRYHIKSWITDWDIQRLYGRSTTIETEPLQTEGYEENKLLEQAPPVEEAEAGLA